MFTQSDANRMVQSEASKIARQQGGTELAVGNLGAGKHTPSDGGRELDLTRGNPNPSTTGGGMGHTSGEYQSRRFGAEDNSTFEEENPWDY